MPQSIVVICVSCGATLQRHPAMRLRKIICFECQRQQRNERDRKKRQAQRIKLAIDALANEQGPEKPGSE
jgi:hypothetical protein